MNTNGEPDLIEQQFSFNRDLRALAFDGSDLWGIVTVATQTVIRIDPATATVIESYEVPDVDVSWSGLEFAPDGMYMLGTDAAGSGVMIRMTAPSTVTAVPPPVTASGDLLLESVESSGAKPVSIAAPMSASLHR